MSNPPCLHCGEPIDVYNHGNRQYCVYKGCYWEAKKNASSTRYHNKKDALHAFYVSDMILKHFCKIYGEDVFILGILLDQAGMNWQISKSELIIDSLPIKIIGNYGYCLFENETVKIWKTLSLQTENQ